MTAHLWKTTLGLSFNLISVSGICAFPGGLFGHFSAFESVGGAIKPIRASFFHSFSLIRDGVSGAQPSVPTVCSRWLRLLPFLWPEFGRRVSWDQEQRSHWMHVTQGYTDRRDTVRTSQRLAFRPLRGSRWRHLRGAPSAISRAVMPKDHRSLWKQDADDKLTFSTDKILSLPNRRWQITCHWTGSHFNDLMLKKSNISKILRYSGNFYFTVWRAQAVILSSDQCLNLTIFNLSVLIMFCFHADNPENFKQINYLWLLPRIWISSS